MKKQICSLFIILCLPLFLVACVSPQKSMQKAEKRYQALLSKTPIEVEIDLPYIDAYANLKYNYDKCIARSSWVANNPDTIIETKLDRENQLGIINSYYGRIIEILQVTPTSTQQTKIKMFTIVRMNEKRIAQKKQLMTNYSKERMPNCPFRW